MDEEIRLCYSSRLYWPMLSGNIDVPANSGFCYQKTVGGVSLGIQGIKDYCSSEIIIANQIFDSSNHVEDILNAHPIEMPIQYKNTYIDNHSIY